MATKKIITKSKPSTKKTIKSKPDIKKVSKSSKKLSNQELVDAIINKQLEPFGKTIDDVRNVDGWYQKYEVTPEENQEWIDWGVDFILKNTNNPFLRNKDNVRKEMDLINLGWGLKVKYPKGHKFA